MAREQNSNNFEAIFLHMPFALAAATPRKVCCFWNGVLKEPSKKNTASRQSVTGGKLLVRMAKQLVDAIASARNTDHAARDASLLAESVQQAQGKHTGAEPICANILFHCNQGQFRSFLGYCTWFWLSPATSMSLSTVGKLIRK